MYWCLYLIWFVLVVVLAVTLVALWLFCLMGFVGLSLLCIWLLLFCLAVGWFGVFILLLNYCLSSCCLKDLKLILMIAWFCSFWGLLICMLFCS